MNFLLIGFAILCYSWSIFLAGKYPVTPTRRSLPHAKKRTLPECFPGCGESGNVNARQGLTLLWFSLLPRCASPPTPATTWTRTPRGTKRCGTEACSMALHRRLHTHTHPPAHFPPPRRLRVCPICPPFKVSIAALFSAIRWILCG